LPPAENRRSQLESQAAISTRKKLAPFALWLKKLEESKFPWPKDFEDQVVKVSAADLEMMLSGINVWSKFKEVHFEQVV
jgi:hypothetical protein